MRCASSLLVTFAVFVLVAACGGSSTDPGPGGTASGPDAAAGRDGGPEGDGHGFDPLSEGGADDGCRQCSADLHDVLTCGSSPQVVQTCQGNLGCGPSGCIPACDAAAASKSTIGCDYYAIPPDVWSQTNQSGGAAGSCFAAFVNNGWSTDMNVTLVWKGQTINGNDYAYLPKGAGSAITYEKIPSKGIPPGSMAIVFLNDYSQGQGSFQCRCPAGVQAAITNEDVVVHQTSIGHAVEIKTSVPAIVYDIYPFGGAISYVSSASLLLPITAWDTNYVTTTMAVGYDFPSGIDFVAQQDNTKITLLPTADIAAGTGVAAATKGTATTYTINKGETVHLMQPAGNANADLTGSIVQSSVPVGVWGEHFCMTQPTPPPWRVVGLVDGTTLTYDPPVSGAPATLNQGQLVEFDGAAGFATGLAAFRVTSQDAQHPFYLAAHRPGMDCDAAHQQIPPIKALGNEYVAVANESSGWQLGGPETVNVVPSAQFLTSYIFFTDPTYGYTEIALTRAKAADNAFHDVTLDCLGTVTGWQDVGTSGKYQYAHVELAKRDPNDPQSTSTAVGKCDNGLHTIKSDVPFGITVWGYDSASSYAYPGGASVKPINTVTVPTTPK